MFQMLSERKLFVTMPQKDNNEHLSQNETDNIFPFLSPLRNYDKLRGKIDRKKRKYALKQNT